MAEEAHRRCGMKRPRILDLFCCEGGAADGYHKSGFDVVGVDISPQPRYPYEFHQADALDFLAEHGHEFDLIHASPPCQQFTLAWKLRRNNHPDLIAATRDALTATGRPWVIENVPGAPLQQPILLCGAMFPGLRVYRHRLFESNFPLRAPRHPGHVANVTKMGRPPRDGEFMHVVGNFSGVEQAKEAMGGLHWMSRDGLRECIPPAYAEFVGTAWMTGELPEPELALFDLLDNDGGAA